MFGVSHKSGKIDCIVVILSFHCSRQISASLRAEWIANHMMSDIGIFARLRPSTSAMRRNAQTQQRERTGRSKPNPSTV